MGSNATSQQCSKCHVWHLKPGMRPERPSSPRLDATGQCPECLIDSDESKRRIACAYPWVDDDPQPAPTPAPAEPVAETKPAPRWKRRWKEGK